jgi:hypothetical protein
MLHFVLNQSPSGYLQDIGRAGLANTVEFVEYYSPAFKSQAHFTMVRRCGPGAFGSEDCPYLPSPTPGKLCSSSASLLPGLTGIPPVSEFAHWFKSPQFRLSCHFPSAGTWWVPLCSMGSCLAESLYHWLLTKNQLRGLIGRFCGVFPFGDKGMGWQISFRSCYFYLQNIHQDRFLHK